MRSRGVQTPRESGLEPILLPVEGRAGPQCASVHRRCHLRPDKPAAIEVCCGSEARARPAESTSTPASSHTCSAAEICCSHSTTCTHGTCSTVCYSTAKLSIRLLSQPLDTAVLPTAAPRPADGAACDTRCGLPIKHSDRAVSPVKIFQLHDDPTTKIHLVGWDLT